MGNINAIEIVLWKNNEEIMKYLMSIEGVKERYLNDMEIRWRLVFRLNQKYNKQMARYLMNTLELNEEKLKTLQQYQCRDESNKCGPNGWKYWLCKISDDAIKQLLQSFK